MRSAEASSIQVRLGEPVSYGGLTVVPMFSDTNPGGEFVSLDEGLAAGLSVEEVDQAGSVESIRVTNPLASDVLVYEGEAVAGGKQDRIFDRPVLVPKHACVDVPVLCVERGRWSSRARRFESPPHAAYPTLRHAGHTLGQAGAWSDVHAKSLRLGADSAEAMYTTSRRKLNSYLGAVPCQAGQCGSIVGLCGKIVCLDFISRPDVHARVYPKLMRGYALDAIEVAIEQTLPDDAAEEALAELVTAQREPVQTGGRGELRRLCSTRAIGWELRLGQELITLTVFAT